jgi:D-glycero-alpha-D-manno-heptose-7-phosphate kinase
VDLGGTLDIRTFYAPLRRLHPQTVNIALELRTRVLVRAFRPGQVQVMSQGFSPACHALDDAPFDHPLGLIFAIAAYFGIDGLSIEIISASPPRSALGGSSSAAVALITALDALQARRGDHRRLSRRAVALLAHAIEESVAGVPCGMQDHLAALYGGATSWHWPSAPGAPAFRRERLVPHQRLRQLERNLLVAYCGEPHASRDVNGSWVRQFLSGAGRSAWAEIARLSADFAAALRDGTLSEAVRLMNRETAMRCEMTPEVLDDVGQALVAAARRGECGARFTGAGGGGCVWAIGDERAIAKLEPQWRAALAMHPRARLLARRIATTGIRCRWVGTESAGTLTAGGSGVDMEDPSRPDDVAPEHWRGSQ